MNGTIIQLQKYPKDHDFIRNMTPPMSYKYRDWQKGFHRDILTKQEIYFSSPKDFTDELDCRFPVDFYFSTYEKYEKIFMHFKKTVDKLTCDDAQIKNLARDAWNEHLSTPEKRKLAEKEFYDVVNKTIGIFSFSNVCDSPRMWDSYAEGSTGFCVGISLRECCEELRGAEIEENSVKYLPQGSISFEYNGDFGFSKIKQIDCNLDVSDIETEVFLLHLLNTKLDSFAFEEEYRLNKELINSPADTITSDVRKLRLPKYCFKEIIFGEKMSQESVDEIISVCRSQALDIKFKIARQTLNDSTSITDYI
jgi:Protein of unknown function (DUF2971)